MKKLLFTYALVYCFSPMANAVVINFDDLATGTIVDSEYAPLLNVSVKNLGGGPDVGVIFDTLHPTGGDADLGGPFNSSNPDFPGKLNTGNVLIIHENHNCNADSCRDPDDEGSRSAGTFFFDFGTMINLESIDFFDIENAENGKSHKNAIKLFDEADIEIVPNTFYTPDTGGDNMWDQRVFNVEGVKRIELNMGGSGAIDNIRFTVVPIPPGCMAVWYGSNWPGWIGQTSSITKDYIIRR